MLHRLPVLLAFLLLSFRSLAQVYEPGWLVRSTGDTVRGEIENNFWQEPPTAVRFRPSAAGPSLVMQPRQLRAFGFANGRYFRYEALPIDHAADTRLDMLPRGNFTKVQTDSLLAEVLLTGSVSVLRVYRPGSTHYYFLRSDRPLLALWGRRYLSQAPDGSWRATDGNNYRNQLNSYFADCPAAVSAAQQAAFTPGELLAVAQVYNEACSPAHQPGRSWLSQARVRRPLAFQGGVLAGLRYNRIQSPASLLAPPCTDCEVHPFGGLYGELLLPSRRTAIYGELSLSRFRNELAQTYYVSSTSSVTAYDVFDYRAWLGTARVGLRYFVDLPREQQLLFGVGLEFNHVMGVHYTSRYGAVEAPAPNTDFRYASPTVLPNLNVGWRWQRYTTSFDAQFYNSVNSKVAFGSVVALRLGLAYRLGRSTDAARL
jgi:hypothetical protein